MGVTSKERVGRLEEGLQVLRMLWTGPAAFDGKYSSFPEIDLEPKPVQKPCPIWIASNPNPNKLSPDTYSRAIRRVATTADGWQTTVALPEEFGERWREIKGVAEQEGRDPEALESSIHLMINVGDDEGTCRREAKRFLDEYYSTDVQPETMDAWGAYGPPSRVAERLNEYIDQGLDVPILRFASFQPRAQFEAAVEKLLPQLTA